MVATVGTVLYSGDDSFTIKKSIIRGEVSEGMICSEVEIGVGKEADGIMVLPKDVANGTLASDYFNVETDYVFEIGLTPNRADAMSHFGVARDLKAYFNAHQTPTEYHHQSQFDLNIPNGVKTKISVENQEDCKRYAGVNIDNITVKDSPEWLQNRLKAIGLSPINNIVDITNYVLHEYGQPLHAFDADKIKGNHVIVKNLPQDSQFITLDNVERKLDSSDLMICDENGGMCIAGVFGGAKSGISEATKNVFLESAYFDPVSIRKSSKRHHLKTDASFRFERGIDPNITITALERAVSLILEIAGGEISSQITDLYPAPITHHEVSFNAKKSNELLGQEIPESFVKAVLNELEIDIEKENGNEWTLKVPAYRVDVTRSADITEEILRMFGYNNIDIPSKLNASLVNPTKPDNENIKNIAFNYLSDIGFNETLNNSLTNPKEYTSLKEYNPEEFVNLLNPISNELAILRPDMIGGGLTSIAYNLNRKANTIKFYEFGKTYLKKGDHYKETQFLSLWVAGQRRTENWANQVEPVSFFYLKGAIENLLLKLGFNNISFSGSSNSKYSDVLTIQANKKNLGEIGRISDELKKTYDIETDVYYAEINWDKLFKAVANNTIKYQPIPKFPAARRDLSLLVDQKTQFAELEELAKGAAKGLLTEVGLFDVYEGKNLPHGKKSYALYFILQDETKTLNDKIIEKTMNKIQFQFEQKVGATLR